MAQQTINVGATANDGTGDGIRTAYIKCNDNFQELYNTTITPTSVPNGTSNLSVADSANVTITIAGSANVVNFAGTVTEFTGNISATGDISAGNSLTVTQDVTIGDQLTLTGTIASNIFPDTNNTRHIGNATLRFAQVNSVLMNATGNITSTANISGANIIATQDVIIAGQHVTTGNVTSSGNISGGNLLTGGRVVATGNVVSSANVSALNLVTTGAGNVVTAGFFKGDGGFLSNVTAASNVAVTQIANGTSVVGISSSGGNVELTSGGTLSFQTNGTNLDILIPTTSAANVTTTANVSGGNLLTGGRVVATGNIVSSGNVSGTNFLGNGSFLTGISTNSISNGTSNVTVASGADTTIGVAGTTRLTVSATGTAVAGLMTATGNITATGNVAGGNLKTGGAVIGATVAGDGSALTALNGTNIASGTVAAARVATLNQNTTGSAATLTTARAIALSGDVVGTADFDGSAGISIATTIQANSVALGTDTTGNYVAAGAVSGVGLSGSASAEGATFTVTSNATSANTNSTIVARDGSGDFSAGTITATATAAQYADLAENYLADHEYDPGTVISIGGPHEITICGLGDYPAGVISTDPAYLMNSGLTAGLPVALVGRVPVKVFGSVDKGQLVYSDIKGRASTNSVGRLVGISLEDNVDEGEKLVECMLKL